MGSLAVGDFNDDGKPDLVTTGGWQVTVLLGNGNGTFQPPASFAVGSLTEAVAVGDFNGDGKLDLGVTSNGSYGFANVLLGNGTGSFAAPITSWLGFGRHISAAVADFNGDGKLDFAAADLGWAYNPYYAKVTVLRGAGAGTFGEPDSFDVGYYPQSVTAGDVNADGKIDLVTGNSDSYGGSVSVLLGNGLGSFGPAQSNAAGFQPLAVKMADF